MILVPGLGFRGCQLLDVRESLKLLSSSHLCGGDHELLSGIFAGGVWNEFLLGRARREIVACDFVVVQMLTGIFSGSALALTWFISAKFRSFTEQRVGMRVLGLGVFCGMAACFRLSWRGALRGLTRSMVLSFIGWIVCWGPILTVSVGNRLRVNRFTAGFAWRFGLFSTQ